MRYFMRIAVMSWAIASVTGCTHMAERQPTVTIPDVHPKEASRLIAEEMIKRGYHSQTLYYFWRRVNVKPSQEGAPQAAKDGVWEEEHISYFELPDFQGEALTVSVRMFQVTKRAGVIESRTDVTARHFNQLQADLEDMRTAVLSRRTYTRHRPTAPKAPDR